MKQLKLDNRTTVDIPSIPNFIRCGLNTEHITRFTSDELKRIGFEWVNELVKKADKKRNQRSKIKKSLLVPASYK